MRYVLDHDYHIHTKTSLCSGDENQTVENIITYAEESGFKKIVITNHFWDETVALNEHLDFYGPQNFSRISSERPFPTSKNVEVLFGCETDMDSNLVIGITKKTCEKFDFIIVPTTHLHMFCDKNAGVKERKDLFIKRFEAFLNSDLPFKKVGLAHITCPLIANKTFNDHIEVINSITDKEFYFLFERFSKLGAGFELNFPTSLYDEKGLNDILRPYKIAKNCGCKFYMGSDAHTYESLSTYKQNFERIVDLLDLKEEDKFIL